MSLINKLLTTIRDNKLKTLAVAGAAFALYWFGSQKLEDIRFKRNHSPENMSKLFKKSFKRSYPVYCRMALTARRVIIPFLTSNKDLQGAKSGGDEATLSPETQKVVLDELYEKFGFDVMLKRITSSVLFEADVSHIPFRLWMNKEIKADSDDFGVKKFLGYIEDLINLAKQGLTPATDCDVPGFITKERVLTTMKKGFKVLLGMQLDFFKKRLEATPEQAGNDKGERFELFLAEVDVFSEIVLKFPEFENWLKDEKLEFHPFNYFQVAKARFIEEVGAAGDQFRKDLNVICGRYQEILKKLVKPGKSLKTKKTDGDDDGVMGKEEFEQKLNQIEELAKLEVEIGLIYMDTF